MDSLRFLLQLLRRPTQIAAISPSSTGLAREMLDGIDFHGGRVLELGPGTGVFTREAIRRGCKEDCLDLMEINPEFCRSLEREFPAARVHNVAADRIGDLEALEFETVISGLPVLSMPEDIQRAILQGILTHLSESGTYVQFTYGRRPPYPDALLEELDVAWSKSRRIWRNLPPATVYRFTRQTMY